jgi:hypothetical protein
VWKWHWNVIQIVGAVSSHVVMLGNVDIMRIDKGRHQTPQFLLLLFDKADNVVQK